MYQEWFERCLPSPRLTIPRERFSHVSMTRHAPLWDFFSHIQEARPPKPSVGRDAFPRKALGEVRSLLLPVSGSSRLMGASLPSSPSPPSSSGFGLRRSRPCLRVHMASSSSVHLSFLSVSLKRILVTGFRAHPDNPGWLPGNLIASSETLFTHKVTFTGSMNVMWAYLLGVTIQSMEGGNCLF